MRKLVTIVLCFTWPHAAAAVCLDPYGCDNRNRSAIDLKAPAIPDPHVASDRFLRQHQLIEDRYPTQHLPLFDGDWNQAYGTVAKRCSGLIVNQPNCD